MNSGDSRKDQSCYFPWRRSQTFDRGENARNGIPYSPLSQSSSYSNNMAAPHRQSLGCWIPHGYMQPHGHRASAVHRFPGHQIFLQHGPFGGENNQYRPVGYLHQFSMRFPQNHEHQLPSMLDAESRRNGFDYQCDRRHYDDTSKSRYDFGGQNSRERGFRIDQGIRQIPGKFQNSKVKVYRKKKNQNNSSNATDGDSANVRSKKVKQKCNENEEAVLSKVYTDDIHPHCQINSPRKPAHSQTVDCTLEEKDKFVDPLKCELKGPEVHCPVALNNDFVNCEDEGAVGGDVNFCDDRQSLCLSLNEDYRLDRSSVDKNLIDEGAVCDLDKEFQHQEFSWYCDDNKDDFQLDSDFRADFRQADEGISAGKCDDDFFRDVSDDESESENCSYVYNPQPAHVKNDALCTEHLQCNCKLAGSCAHRHFGETRAGDVSAVGRPGSLGNGDVGDSSDNGEDTGDFIDTDLPSHNKHILSSSDEMDNNSSSSSSDHEDVKEQCNGYGARKKSDPDCNNLSSFVPKFHNELEALSLSEIIDKKKSLSSQFQTLEDSKTSEVASLPFRRVLSPCSSSSESENGDGSIVGSHSELNAAQVSPLPYVCYVSGTPCQDGSAASQVAMEGPQKLKDDLYISCAPGAGCELPQASLPPCFFHSNMMCPRGRPGQCSSAISSPNPAREHIAFTASSAPDLTEVCAQTRKQEIASWSASAGSGACCPQLSQVNDLNACCHHSHSHIANGFSQDRPETNFSNDESNRHQKIFVKFPSEDKVDERGSHPASSSDLEDVNGFNLSGRKQEKSTDRGGSEDPLGNDTGDSVDMVLLPMEEEIEPVHHMSAGLCAGGGLDTEEFYHDLQLAAWGGSRGTTQSHNSCDDHQYVCPHDQNPLRNGMPSKEFYDLIKTVSTTDSYMRFYDKDGQDVQRQPFVACEDESGRQNVAPGGQSSKTERLKVDRVMIWNEYEAYVMQFKQIAVSACGQTAVLNVLKALKFNFEKAAVCKIIQTNLRKEDACIPEYLFSRARAGTTAEELMQGVEKLSGGAVGGRFFHFWPPRKVKLLQWLAYWMKRGAIPMATLNLQQGPHSLWQVPDSWHHQMVYGVSHQGLYLTNPLEIVSERSAMKQLCSDSVLMVRRQDVISRFRETTDLGRLLEHPDPRWRTMNVLGQVVNVLREFNMPSVPGYRLQVTSHVSIPASYKAGVTLFMPKDKLAWTTLLNAPEIPQESDG